MEYLAADTRYQTMPYQRAGKTGLRLPALSLGLWHNFGSVDNFDTMRAMLRCAFDAGIIHFDLANNYGPVPGSAEENFGRLLALDFKPYRDELCISTKAGYHMWEGPYGEWGSRKAMLASLDQSLQRLGLDYVDIFYSHRFDPDTPLEETMGALAAAVHSGKALYAGISNYDGEQSRKAASLLRDLHCPFVLNQSRYSIMDRRIEENGLLQAAQDEGFGLICFSPLFQGMLTNRYLHGVPEDSRMAREAFLKSSALTEQRLTQITALNELARQRGQSLAQMALAWVLRRDEVTSVLIGASRPAQILDNLGALNAAPFTTQELQKIEIICAGQPAFWR